MDRRALVKVGLNRALNTIRAYRDLISVEMARPRPKGGATADGPILVISTAFPPATWGGVFRPLSFSNKFVDIGWDTVVMTQSGSAGSRPGSYASHERLENGVNVIRLPTKHRKVLKPAFPSTDGRLSEAYANARFAFKHFRRDGRPPRLVLASGPAFDNFTFARHVARRFDVPLVLDYRDDWSDCPFDFVNQGKHDVYFERRALESADVAVFVTESLLRLNTETFGSVVRRAVIPNGYDSTVFTRPIVRWPRPKKKVGEFVVAYSGSFESHVEPIDFIETIEAARARSEEFRRHIVFETTGRLSADVATEIENRNLTDVIRCRPPVAHREIPDVLRRADALMILNPAALRRSLPGKFFEYMSTELPIWVFGTDGEVPDVVRRTGAGVLTAWANPCAAIEKARILLQPDAGPWTSRARSEWALDHTRDRSAARMAELIENILVGGVENSD